MAKKKNNKNKEEKKSSSKKKKEEEDSETVEIKESVLQQVLDRQEKQEEEIENLKKENEKLTEIADKKRLSQYEKNNEGELIRKYRVGVWKGDLIVGWERGEDTVRVTDKGEIVSNQTVILHLENDDGEVEKKEVKYKIWASECDTIEGEMLSERVTKEKDTIFELRLPNGRTIDLDSTFVNPF